MSARLRQERLKESLDKLSECEHEQIFAIVRKYTEQFTCSETGVYVSAENVNEACMTEIEKYIDFCNAQKRRLDADEAKRLELYKSVHSN